MKTSLRNLWKENKYLVMFLVLMFMFRSAVADWNEVPTGSMKPTIVEGDRIFVNKMAYDIRVPFTHISLLKRADPVRGEIIIFDSEESGKRLVKRVVGIPGDVVEMRNNVLTVNGKRLSYTNNQRSSIVIDKTEDLFGAKHLVRITPSRQGYFSSFPPIKVPDAHYFVLGDNRDNSADSRVIGFVPREEIVGRSTSVVMSLDYDNYYIPRADRFFHPL